MPSPTLSRRALITGAGTAIASAALAVPALNAVRADEVCTLPIEAAADRIDRLVSELSAALDEEYGGDYEAVIGPSGAVSYRWAYPSPQQRVEESISELKSALVELDAGPVRAVVSSDTGALVEKLEGKPFMRGVPPVLWRIA